MNSAPETIDEMLGRAAGSTAGGGLRFLDRDGTPTFLSWPSIVGRADRTASSLAAIGVGIGDRVGLVFPTAPAFFDAFFGVLLAGGVPVPLYPPVRLGRLEEYRERTTRMLLAVGARLLLTDRRTYRVLGEVARDARPALGCRILQSPSSSSAQRGAPGEGHIEPVGSDQISSSSSAGRSVGIARRASPTDLAFVQFSSGTTMSPKPVALSHRAVVSQALLLNQFWPDTEEVHHAGVSWLPLYHDMGLIGCVMPALERAATLTLVPPEVFVVRPAVWLQTISKYRATISPAPNFAYSLAVQRIDDAELDGVDLSCWRVALCGAETVVPDVMRAFAHRFARWGFRAEALTPVYGLSEAALAVTFSDPAQGLTARRFDRRALAAGTARETPDGRELVSLGRPLRGFDVRIVDPEGTSMREGQVGSIECRGPSMMTEYLGDEAATARVLRNGWLVTGDLGFVHRGELYVTGRCKDMLVIRGANHSPDEVERAVQGVDGVRAGCAVAVGWLPEDADGERLVLFVEARRGVAKERFETIASACTRSVAAATGLVPDRVVVVLPGTLPRTSSGKLRRNDTLTQFLEGRLGPPAPATGLRLAGAIARSTLAHAQAKLRGSSG